MECQLRKTRDVFFGVCFLKYFRWRDMKKGIEKGKPGRFKIFWICVRHASHGMARARRGVAEGGSRKSEGSV